MKRKKNLCPKTAHTGQCSSARIHICRCCRDLIRLEGLSMRGTAWWTTIVQIIFNKLINLKRPAMPIGFSGIPFILVHIMKIIPAENHMWYYKSHLKSISAFKNGVVRRLKSTRTCKLWMRLFWKTVRRTGIITFERLDTRNTPTHKNTKKT